MDKKNKELEKILETILHLDPQDKGAKRQLENLRDKQKYFDEGKVYFDKGNYEKALDCFYKVCGIDSDYQGTFDLIARAEELLKEETEIYSIEGQEEHFEEVIESLLDGRVVFFLGLDMNPAQRPPNVKWQSKQNSHLPSCQELAAYLATKNLEGNFNLAKVTQDFAVNRSYGPLRDKLDKLYKKSYHPKPIHHFCVNLSEQLNEKVLRPKHPIIVTTNYDDVLERTFEEANQSFDLLYTLPLKEHNGKFAHICFDSKEGWSIRAPIIEHPNKYILRPYQRPLIIKVNGIANHLIGDYRKGNYYLRQQRL